MLAKARAASKVAALVLVTACPVDDEPARASLEIDPAEGLAGERVTVHVRGTNTRFDLPDFSATFRGGDVEIVEQRRDSSTAARLVIDLDEGAAGPRTLQIVAGGELFEKTFQILAVRVEASVEIEPGVGTPGAEMDVQLTGHSTHFVQGETTLSFPEVARTQVLWLVVGSEGTARARIRIDPASPGGAVSVAVTTRDVVLYDRFEIVTEA